MNPYKLARKILPTRVQVLLGNRNKVKRYTLDPLLFHFTRHPHEEQLTFERAHTRGVPESALENNPFIEPVIIRSYRNWYDCEQVQQVTRTRGEIFIEPTTGWPMSRGRKLYSSLFPAGLSPYMAVPRYQAILKKEPAKHFEKIVSLRNVNENGYSHFYTDLMAKLALVKSLGLPTKDYTIIISKSLAQRAYAKFLLANMPLVKEFGPVFEQGDEYVTADEALFVNVFGNPTNSPVFMDVVKNVKASHPLPATVANRKIFLTRGPHRRRTMHNNDEIFAILAAKGFESVDADDLTLPQQIELFTHCRHLVGIHGAGLVNMLYRSPNHMSLFEICEPIVSANWGLNAQYHNMAVALGFDYGNTKSEIRNVDTQSFYLPPERFAADFERFWAKYGD